MANTNYIPTREKELDIPDFLQSKMDKTTEMVTSITNALEQGAIENKSNQYHLKELDKIAEAYSEEEAKVIVKRIVSNYPDIVLTEVASLIKDMQELSGSILRNSKIFATKRGEV